MLRLTTSVHHVHDTHLVLLALRTDIKQGLLPSTGHGLWRPAHDAPWGLQAQTAWGPRGWPSAVPAAGIATKQCLLNILQGQVPSGLGPCPLTPNSGKSHRCLYD